MKPLQIIGKILKAAAPIAAGIFIGPEAGAVIAGSLGIGYVTNRAGKVVQSKTGLRPHKVATPVAAVGLPALLAPLVAPGAVDQVCQVLVKVCENPAALGAIPGIMAWMWHSFSSGVEKSGGSK